MSVTSVSAETVNNRYWVTAAFRFSPVRTKRDKDRYKDKQSEKKKSLAVLVKLEALRGRCI